MTTEIPRIDPDDDRLRAGAPAWIPLVDSAGKRLKPLIRCMCGKPCGIGLHHVHADGTVTASFFHAKNPGPSPVPGTAYVSDGCDWHVWLKLKDYDWGEFPPDKS